MQQTNPPKSARMASKPSSISPLKLNFQGFAGKMAEKLPSNEEASKETSPRKSQKPEKTKKLVLEVVNKQSYEAGISGSKCLTTAASKGRKKLSFATVAVQSVVFGPESARHKPQMRQLSPKTTNQKSEASRKSLGQSLQFLRNTQPSTQANSPQAKHQNQTPRPQDSLKSSILKHPCYTARGSTSPQSCRGFKSMKTLLSSINRFKQQQTLIKLQTQDFHFSDPPLGLADSQPPVSKPSIDLYKSVNMSQGATLKMGRTLGDCLRDFAKSSRPLQFEAPIPITTNPSPKTSKNRKVTSKHTARSINITSSFKKTSNEIAASDSFLIGFNIISQLEQPKALHQSTKPRNDDPKTPMTKHPQALNLYEDVQYLTPINPKSKSISIFEFDDSVYQDFTFEDVRSKPKISKFARM